jgi:hypothetical protein
MSTLPAFRSAKRFSTRTRIDDTPRASRAGLILKLLALAACYALVADAESREPRFVRITEAAAPPSTQYGEPRVLSSLGEPLDVRIPLLGDDAAIAAEARYVLGHADTKLGLPIVRNANIRVVKDAGGWALRVRSATINHEPALALVIQEQLPSGTLSRAIPLLFDPAGAQQPASLPVMVAHNEAPPSIKLVAAPGKPATGKPIATVPPLARVATRAQQPRTRREKPQEAPQSLAASAVLRLATTLSPIGESNATRRESMRWLRRTLLEVDNRAALLAMSRKLSQLVAQVEEMEARIAAAQPPMVTRTASATPANQPAVRPSRRPG